MLGRYFELRDRREFLAAFSTADLAKNGNLQQSCCAA
jgi:hypothetical protein